MSTAAPPTAIDTVAKVLVVARDLILLSVLAPLLASKDLVFSTVSLLIGFLYLFGTWQAWGDLRNAR